MKYGNKLVEDFLSESKAIVADTNALKSFQRDLIQAFGQPNVEYARMHDVKSYDYKNGYVIYSYIYDIKTWNYCDKNVAKILEKANFEPLTVVAGFIHWESIGEAKPKSPRAYICVKGHNNYNLYHEFSQQTIENAKFDTEIKEFLKYSASSLPTEDMIDQYLWNWKSVDHTKKHVSSTDTGYGSHASSYHNYVTNSSYSLKGLIIAFKKTTEELEKLIKDNFRFQREKLNFDWKSGVMNTNGSYGEKWD